MNETGGMELKRTFFGTVIGTGEVVEIEDWRKTITTATMHPHGTTSLGDEPYCNTQDERKVRCTDAKYVNVEMLEGHWEIHDHDEQWKALSVSLHDPR